MFVMKMGCAPGEAVLPTSDVNVAARAVDATLLPSVESLPGLKGGAPRPVGAVAKPDGTTYEIVANEIVLHAETPAELNAFIARYGATILRDGADNGGYYLLRIDPATSPLDDVAAQLDGHTFSSEETARTFAAALRESAAGAELNELNQLQASSLEGPEFLIEGEIHYIDAGRFLEFQQDSDPNQPGDQGYSVGVVDAWDYLSYHGVREVGPAVIPIIAIVDDGFALDGQGVPLNGNLDFGAAGVAPLQHDFAEDDDFAGGPNHHSDPKFKWHGQSSFGVSCALPRNRYGTAGTGGHFVRPMLLRGKDADSDARAIRYAADRSAAVISNSYTQNNRYNYMADAIAYARSKRAIVIASAGNGVKDVQGKVTMQDTGSVDIFPCEYPGVICVGGIDLGLKNAFNYGDGVDIWAPNELWTTPNPDSGTNTHGFPSLGVYSGTSASAPFVAGIVGTMIAAMPEITEVQILSVLQATANTSTDPLVARGWVDAFRAANVLRPNRAPTVTIAQPLEGQAIGWKTRPLFKCTYVDPEIDPTQVSRANAYHGTVIFSSDIDGELCRAETPPYNCFSIKSELTIGEHRVTATAIDPYGATGTHEIRLSVVNTAPQPTIEKPLTGAAMFSHIPVEFRAFVVDDEDLPDASITWTSSRDGALGTGRSLTRLLSAGTHTITLTAVDGKGLSASTQVNINVQTGAGKPTPVILLPAISGEVFAPGQTITLSGARLEWYSSVDGFLGTGNTIQVRLSGLAQPCDHRQHLITLKATDSNGNVVTVQITVYIGVFC